MYTISEITEIWQKSLKIIEKKLKDQNAFDSVFHNSYIENIINDTVTIIASNQVAVQLMASNFKKIVVETLKEITGEEFSLDVRLKNKEKNKINIKTDYYENNLDINNIYFKDAKLDKTLRFDNFIVGSFNKSAYRVAHIVSETPGKKYNPLFIHSNSGLGKTHLLHAIGNYIVEHTSDRANVLYIPASVFIDEYIKFVTGDKSLQNLKDFFNNVDVLLFDDVQFLAEKVKSQEMFFAIYEKLVTKGKQIVIASDRHPNDLKGLEQRLVTRFQQGLVINITEPDVDSCIEILKAKIKANDLNPIRFDEDVLKFYAEKYSNSVRELEGSINRLIFEIENLDPKERITMDVAISIASGFSSSKHIAKQLTEQKIISAVANYYQIPVEKIRGESREASIVKARHVSIYLIYIILKDISLKKIGAMFGGKDHSTIKYSVEKVEKELKTNIQTKNAINKIKESLNIK